MTRTATLGVHLTMCVVIALVSSPARAEAPAASSKASQPTSAALQGRRIEKADLTLNSYPTRDGSANVEARGGDLEFHKSIRANGSYSVTLQTPHDSVALAVDAHRITITRDRKTVALALGSATEDDFDRVQQLLAGSRAIRLLRTAAASLEDSGDDSPESSSFILSDAVVGMLTGDSSAPIRAARHLTRHIRANVKPAGMQVDCYTTWEQRIYSAYNDFEACVFDFAVWDPTRYLCAARWLIQAESYWFSFITCSGFSQF